MFHMQHKYRYLHVSVCLSVCLSVGMPIYIYPSMSPFPLVGCLEGGCGAAAQTGASAATTTTIAVVIVVLAVVILVIVGLLLYTWKVRFTA